MSPKKILVVDDEEGILEVIHDYIEMSQLGLKVLTATNVDSAVSIVEKENPDVILTDISMPGKSGIDFLKILQSRPKMIPTIVISGYGDKDLISKAWKYGAFDFLDKPINQKRLIENIKIAIEQSGNLNKLQHSLQVDPPNVLVNLSEAQYLRAANKSKAAQLNVSDWALKTIVEALEIR